MHSVREQQTALPFTVHEAPVADGPYSPVLLEAPHTSTFVPEGMIPSRELYSHKGYDIGSYERAIHLQWRLNAALVTSNRSRLFVEHNRTVDFALEGCYPHRMTEARRKQRLHDHYWPYIDAVFGQIRERFLEQGRLPILICVHTYTPIMDGERRPPFNVEGDEDSGLVKILHERLTDHFHQAHGSGRLGFIPELKDGDFSNPVTINGPYNLNKTLPTGEPNDDWGRVMSPHYAEGPNGEKWDFPWALIEIRNDLIEPSDQSSTKNKIMMDIDASAIAQAVEHPRVREDLEGREERFFGSARHPSSRQRRQPREPNA